MKTMLYGECVNALDTTPVRIRTLMDDGCDLETDAPAKMIDTDFALWIGPIERRLEGRRASDPNALISDNSPIKAAIPWVPRYANLPKILEHAVAWERKLSIIQA